MHDNDKIPLGTKVKDRITGFTGILIARTEYLYANETVLIHSPEVVDGKPLPPFWFDSGRIQRVEVETACPVVQTQKEAE